MQRVRDLIDCGEMTVFMASRLQKRPGLVDEHVNFTTLGPIGQVMADISESCKMPLIFQYLDHLAPSQETDVLVMPMWGYDLVLVLPW